MKSKIHLESLLPNLTDQAIPLASALVSMTFLKWIDWYQPEGKNGNSQIARFKNLLPRNCQWPRIDASNPKPSLELAKTELHELANSNPVANECSLFRAFKDCFDFASHLENEHIRAIAEWVTELQINEAPSQIKAREEFDKAATLINPEFMNFQTPTTLASFMAECGEVKANDQVYDPGFGSANLLVAALDDVRQKIEPTTTQTVEKLKIFGVEANPLSFLAGTVRVAFSGCYDFEFYLGNCLESSNPFNSREFTLVLSNPPFGNREAKLNLDDFEIKSRSSSNLFCQHAIKTLSIDGRAVLILPRSIFTRGGADRKLREAILLKNNVQFVADLPGGLFGLGLLSSTSIISIEKNGPTESIRMANASEAFVKQAGSSVHQLIPSKASLLLARIQDVSQNYDDVKSVDYEQIKKLNFVIYPSAKERSRLSPLLNSLDGEISIVRLGDICQITRGSYRGERKPVTPTHSPNSGGLYTDLKKNDNTGQPHDHKTTERSTSAVSIINGSDLLSTKISNGKKWLAYSDTQGLDPESKLLDQDILIKHESKLGELYVSVFQKGNFEAVATPSVQRLRITADTLNADYLATYLQTSEVIQWLDNSLLVSSKSKKINGEKISDLPVPIISMDRQTQQTTSIKTLQDLLTAPPSASQLELDNKIVFWAYNLVNTLIRNTGLSGGYTPEYSMPWLQQLDSLSQSNAPVANCENCSKPYVPTLSPNKTDKDRHYAIEEWATCSQCKIESEDNTGRSQQMQSPAEYIMQQQALKSSAAIWAIAFQESIRPLSGINEITDSIAQLNILQIVRSRLEGSASILDFEFKQGYWARKLQSSTVCLLKSIERHLSDSKELTARVCDIESLHNNKLSFQVEFKNTGTIALRKIKCEFPTEITNSSINIGFLATGESVLITIDEASKPASGFTSLVLNWTARDLEYNQRQGSCNVTLGTPSKKQVSKPNLQPLESSPYVCGDPVRRERSDVFYGREDVIAQIQRSVSGSGNVVLLEGNRRAGKSSILWNLEGPEGVPGWFAVYSSLQGAAGDSKGGIPTPEVFRHIAYDIALAIHKNYGEVTLPDSSVLEKGKKPLGINRRIAEGIGEETAFKDFQEWFVTILQELASKKLGLLLLLDEFDKLQEGIDNQITSPQVPENIRSLLHSNLNFSAVLTGSRRMQRMRQEYWSALFGLGTRIGVTNLKEEDAKKLVVNPVKDLLSYEPGATKRMLELTACQPYLLQCLCNRIFDNCARLNTQIVTTGDVNLASKELVVDNEHFQSLWEYTGSGRKQLILCILNKHETKAPPLLLEVVREELEELGISTTEIELIQDLEYLRELELIKMDGKREMGARYSLAVPLMGDWIANQQDFHAIVKKAQSEAKNSEERAFNEKQAHARQKEIDYLANQVDSAFPDAKLKLPLEAERVLEDAHYSVRHSEAIRRLMKHISFPTPDHIAKLLRAAETADEQREILLHAAKTAHEQRDKLAAKAHRQREIERLEKQVENSMLDLMNDEALQYERAIEEEWHNEQLARDAYEDEIRQEMREEELTLDPNPDEESEEYLSEFEDEEQREYERRMLDLEQILTEPASPPINDHSGNFDEPDFDEPDFDEPDFGEPKSDYDADDIPF